jgi:hypothetical protein
MFFGFLGVLRAFGSPPSPAALLADSEDLVPVGINGKTMGRRDFVLKLLDRLAGEFHDDTAFYANHMVVVLVLVSVLESSQSVLELDGLG